MNQDIIFAIASPFFSSIATIFKAGAAKSLSPVVVWGLGSILGSLILFTLGYVLKQKISFDKIKYNWKSFFSLIVLRTILGEFFFTLGLSQTLAVKAIFFTKIEPYFVILLAWIFLKEKISLRHFSLLSVHLLGAVVLSTGGNIEIAKAQVGDIFIILGMAFFAGSYFFANRLSKDVGSITTNAVSMGIGSIIIFPFMIFFSPFEKIFSSSAGFIYLVIYVILFNVISLTLWFASLKSIKGWVVSALRYVGPVLGAPFAFVLFKETLNFAQIIGALIVIITSFLIVVQTKK